MNEGISLWEYSSLYVSSTWAIREISNKYNEDQSCSDVRGDLNKRFHHFTARKCTKMPLSYPEWDTQPYKATATFDTGFLFFLDIVLFLVFCRKSSPCLHHPPTQLFQSDQQCRRRHSLSCFDLPHTKAWSTRGRHVWGKPALSLALQRESFEDCPKLHVILVV